MDLLLPDLVGFPDIMDLNQRGHAAKLGGNLRMMEWLAENRGLGTQFHSSLFCRLNVPLAIPNPA